MYNGTNFFERREYILDQQHGYNWSVHCNLQINSLNLVSCFWYICGSIILVASTVEDGLQPQEPELLNSPNQRVGSSPADCIQIDAPSNVVGGSKPHDVTMSDTEHSSKSELAKQLFVERTKGFGIPQLERLYTRIMMGVFEAKYPEHRNNLNPNCVSSFLLKFAEDEANF